jgi:hypothetical protein
LVLPQDPRHQFSVAFAQTLNEGWKERDIVLGSIEGSEEDLVQAVGRQIYPKAAPLDRIDESERNRAGGEPG